MNRWTNPLARAAAVAAAFAAPIRSAAACPFCGSEGALAVRGEVFGDGSWVNALAAGAPFAVLLLAVAILARGPKPRGGSAP